MVLAFLTFLSGASPRSYGLAARPRPASPGAPSNRADIGVTTVVLGRAPRWRVPALKAERYPVRPEAVAIKPDGSGRSGPVPPP